MKYIRGDTLMRVKPWIGPKLKRRAGASKWVASSEFYLCKARHLLIEMETHSEKVSLFWKVWPSKSAADQVAFSVTHFGLVGIILFEMLVVLPIYHEPFTQWYMIHLVAGLYIAFGVFTNLYSMIFSNSTITSNALMLPSVLTPGWYYCQHCQMNAPPRAHHCPICEICVLKRDHHCVFTGNCVGYSNHRYFICMAFYLWLGSVYTLLFNLDFFSNTFGGFGLFTIFKMVFPAAAFVFGFCSFYQLVILIISGICFVASFLFTCLMLFQIFFISRGQTQFECKKKIKHYRKSFLENWVEVLGYRWYLPLLGYFFSSSLPGNGTHFSVSSFIDLASENAKDIWKMQQ